METNTNEAQEVAIEVKPKVDLEKAMDAAIASAAEGVWEDLDVIDEAEYARKSDEKGLEELGLDMEKNSQLQNVVLVPKGNGRFECVIGSRRVAAARKRGWKKIRADVKEGLTEVQKLGMVASENDQRKDASPFYTAMVYQRMQQAGNLTQEALAAKVGKDQTVVSDYLILAQVPKEAWWEQQSCLGSMRACLEIAKVKDPAIQKQVVEACVKDRLAAPAVKKLAKKLQSGATDQPVSSAEASEPSGPFQFLWKGNGILIKGRLFKPHTEPLAQYLNELSEAYDRFMEEEKSQKAA